MRKDVPITAHGEAEAKLAALRHTLEASIAAGGEFSPDEVSAALDAKANSLLIEGY